MRSKPTVDDVLAAIRSHAAGEFQDLSETLASWRTSVAEAKRLESGESITMDNCRLTDYGDENNDSHETNRLGPER
jgi:hypothetical protein